MSALRKSILLLCILPSLAITASEPKLGVDPRVNVDTLAASGQIRVFPKKDGRDFEADASAVIAGDFAKLAQASADYNRYVAMGMPYLRASRVVGSAGPDILYVWNWMALSVMGFSEETRHCFEVRFHRAMSGGAAGSEWQIHSCPSGAKNQLPSNLKSEYADEPAFEYLNGSWYMQPFQYTVNGNKEQRIYVRYFLEARPENSLAGLVGGKILQQFERGTRQVIQILAREAGSQP